MNGDTGRQKLGKKPPVWLQLTPVIQQACDENHRSADQQPGETQRLFRIEARHIQQLRQDYACREAEEEYAAAQARQLSSVAFVPAPS